MPNTGVYQGSHQSRNLKLENLDMAQDIEIMVNDKPSWIRLFRVDSMVLTGEPSGLQQLFRIESMSDPADDTSGAMGPVSTQGLLLTGFRGHPTIPDSDCKRGDTFVLNGLKYAITDIIADTRSSLQAIGKTRRL